MKRFLLSLLLASSAVAATSTSPVKIDLAARTAAPINPFIYGQFIEHLGRCIYGGIWAEMLEDRKFYFDVTPEYAPYKSLTDTAYPVVGASPWQIVGAPDSVEMVHEDSFVGEQSPQVQAGSGLRQRDLGLRAGMEYVGYVWVKPVGPAEAKVDVTLSWGSGDHNVYRTTVEIPAGDYTKHTFTLPAGGTTDHATLELIAKSGDVVIGTVSLMPADNVNGLRRDTLALLKDLNGTVYRWPGGNFVSGYNWRDGIGDRDRRPPRKNPAWTGVEHNDFGTDEFIAFCREIGTEPMIAANTGFGDAYSAAQWVEYCNSSAETVAGGWRAKNGSESPYGVKYWCVGNEMWGPWQLGFMQVQQYVLKHNEVVDAMRAVDPNLVLSAVGDLDGMNTAYDPEQVKSGKKWSHRMLEACADHMDLISEHFYEGQVPWTQDGPVDLVTHVGLLKKTIKHKADGHRELQASIPQLNGRVIPIAMDEWNFWHRTYVYGELGCSYDLADGLGTAAGLHEYFRQSDIIQMAFYAQTVNVIGAIKTSKTQAQMETTGLVLQLYRAHFGTVPVPIDPADVMTPLDIAAAVTADGAAFTIAIVNPTAEAVAVPVSTMAGKIAGAGTRWVIAGADRSVHNTPGQPRVVDIGETAAIDAAQPLAVPAFGVALFRFPLR